jgi:hypothetical protein
MVLPSRAECPIWDSAFQIDIITLYYKGGHQPAGDAAQYHTAKVTFKYDACYRTPDKLHPTSRNRDFSAFKLFLFHFCYLLVVNETFISISKFSAI